MFTLKNRSQIETEIVLFLMSRVKIFKRIDYALTIELISHKMNISPDETEYIINKNLISKNKIALNNSSIVLPNR